MRASWPSFKDLSGDPTWSTLQHIHQEMVGDLYEWAGELRTVYVTGSDPETDGPVAAYCQADEVAPGLTALFAQLAEDDFLRGLDDFDFLKGLDRFWGSLTHLHPFRDVNTRSQVAFVAHLAKQAGHPIDWRRVDHIQLQKRRLAAAQGHPNKIHWYLEEGSRMLPPTTPSLPTGLEVWD